jgi:hypothetical protein
MNRVADFMGVRMSTEALELDMDGYPQDWLTGVHQVSFGNASKHKSKFLAG